MRYSIIDLEGAVRDSFQSRRSMKIAMREFEDENPGMASELLVVAYDDDGARCGSERGDEILASPVFDGYTTLTFDGYESLMNNPQTRVVLSSHGAGALVLRNTVGDTRIERVVAQPTT